MYDKFFVGLDLTGAEDNGKQLPISRVTLLLDDDNAITAGDDTGRELVADCPHATQAMVNAILAQVKGHQYQMYSAENANIDPAAELGDGVTVDGIYSVISRIDDDGSGYAGLSAPGEAEMEDEYPAGGPMTREFNRRISETRSRITKTAEQIRLEVSNEIEGLSSSITVELDSITSKIEDTANNLSSEFTISLDSIRSTVKGQGAQISSITQNVDSITQDIRGLDNSFSTLEQKVDSFRLEVSNGETSSMISLKAGSAVISSQEIIMRGLVTFEGLSNGTTTIDGACIKTGQIDADRVNLTGAITFSDLSQSVQSSINTTTNTANSAAGTASSALSTANSLANGTGGGTFINGTTVNSPTVIGGAMIGTTMWFGAGGNIGSLAATYGHDGINYTDVIELASQNGLVLRAAYGMRFNASAMWVDLDVSNVFFRQNGSWVNLATLLQ